MASSAPRSPLAVLRDVRGRLESGWPPGLTVLTGDDTWHLDRALAAILDVLVPGDDRAFALTSHDRDRVAVSTVVGAARSAGMFASRRVVLVRDVALLEGEPDTLEAYAASPPPDSFLIVRGQGLDRRRKIGKLLASAGTWFRFERSALSGDRDLAREVRGMAADRGLDPAPDAIAYLLEATAGDLYAVATELDKIRSWIGAGEGPAAVRLDDVRGLVAPGSTLTGWEIADAVAARDRDRALTAARRLLAAGEEPLRLLGGIAWRTRAMVQAGVLLAAGTGRREVISRVRLGWGGDRVLDGVRRYPPESLLAFPYHIAEADRALKSRGIDPGAVLERLVDRLVGEVSEPGGRRGGRG